MISAALFIYLGVQIGAPSWYYVLVAWGLMINFVKAVVNAAE